MDSDLILMKPNLKILIESGSFCIDIIESLPLVLIVDCLASAGK